MDVFSRDDLRRFMQKPGGLCVSILMPTVRAGTETQQNPIRFRNLMQVAEQRLVDSGVRAPDARSFLEPAADLLGNVDFWRNCQDGLAVFVAGNVFSAYRLPLQVREQVVVNDRFHIKPLLPLFSNDGRFYLLALSQNQVRLLEGTRMTVRDVDLEGADVPANLKEALKYDDFERQLQFHTGSATPGGGARSAMFHGNEVLKDIAKDHILRYFQQIDRGLHDLVRDQRIPLLLAGVEYLLPIYKQANTYNYLMDEGIPGNPDLENAQSLHAQAWSIVGPYFTREQEETIGRYHQFAGTGLATADAAQVVAAAYQGRVDTLLVTSGAEVRGAYRPVTADAVIGEVPGAEDLTDFASMHTVLNGGAVYVLPPERLLDGSGMAAVFRY